MTPTPPQIGPMLQTLLQEVMEGLSRTALLLLLHLVLGITVLLVGLTRAPTEDLEEGVHHTAEVEAEVLVLPVDQAMGSGKMVNTSLGLSISVLNANSSVCPMTPRNCKPVSIFRITTIFPSKHLAKMYPSLACNSQTLLWMTTFYQTSSLQAIRLPHPCKSTLSLSLWVVET